MRCFIICGDTYDFMTVIAMPVNCFAFIWEAQIVLLGDLCILGGEAKVQFYHPQNSIVWGAVEILMFFILIRKLQFTLLMVPLRVRFSHHEQWATIIAFRLYWPHFGKWYIYSIACNTSKVDSVIQENLQKQFLLLYY